MRQSHRTSRIIAAIVTGGATLLSSAATQAQQSAGAKAPRPQSTAGARNVATQPPAERAANPANSRPAQPKQVANAPGGDNAAAKKNEGGILTNVQMPKELDTILGDWERHTAQVKRLDGTFVMMKYETVFETETRAHGQFWYQNPDRGRMNLEQPDLSKFPKDADGNPVSAEKRNDRGTPYALKAHPKETWVCTGSVIRQFNFGDERGSEKTYSEVLIPEQYQGEGIRNSPLPFLFGLKKEEAKRRYVLNLGNMHNKLLKGAKTPIIHIVAHPLFERDAREWMRAEVLLHSDTFLPHSIRTFDPANTGETVYVFTSASANSKWLFKDPFNVSVLGFQKLKSEELDPQIAPVQPAGAKGGSKLFDKPKGANPFGRDKADE